MKIVSVIIPTYERFFSVQESIDSVLKQTYQNIEIIVVDDCSKDPRYMILDSIYTDQKNVKIIHLPQNLREKHNVKTAQGLTRNEGIKVSKGDYISFLDDDDTFCDTNKIQDQVSLMEKYNVSLCSSNMLKGNGVYSKNNDSKTTYYPIDLKIGEQVENGVFKFQRKDIEQTNYINNSTCIISRDMITKCGLQDIGINEDYKYWLKILEHTDGLYIQKEYTYYDTSECKKYYG